MEINKEIEIKPEQINRGQSISLEDVYSRKSSSLCTINQIPTFKEFFGGLPKTDQKKYHSLIPFCGDEPVTSIKDLLDQKSTFYCILKSFLSKNSHVLDFLPATDLQRLIRAYFPRKVDLFFAFNDIYLEDLRKFTPLEFQKMALEEGYDYMQILNIPEIRNRIFNKY